jgi:trk system potassium uptake protein TrkA
MKIIILGAGQVGASLAENLVGENNDITVVDENHEALQELQDRFDLRVVQGSASSPQTLSDAGALDADMLIAVTNSDEINMVACQMAFTLFNVPKKIARIRSQSVVMHEKELFHKDAFPIDHIIAPEKLVSDTLPNRMNIRALYRWLTLLMVK